MTAARKGVRDSLALAAETGQLVDAGEIPLRFGALLVSIAASQALAFAVLDVADAIREATLASRDDGR